MFKIMHYIVIENTFINNIYDITRMTAFIRTKFKKSDNQTNKE